MKLKVAEHFLTLGFCICYKKCQIVGYNVFEMMREKLYMFKKVPKQNIL